MAGGGREARLKAGDGGDGIQAFGRASNRRASNAKSDEASAGVSLEARLDTTRPKPYLAATTPPGIRLPPAGV
jgi:hypothetical protein